MPEEIERRQTGPMGAFPIRFPMAKAVAFLVGLALLPAWWEVGQATTSRLKKFYVSEYWASLKDSWRIGKDGAAVAADYRVLVVGAVSAPILADESTMAKTYLPLRETTISADPKAFHAWLSAAIFHGSPLKIYGLFVTGSVMSFLALLLAGAEVDRRRRMGAMEGTHRRGTRFTSWRGFNRGQLGPLWLLWCVIFWRSKLSAPKVLEAAERGRKFGATWPCYLAATGAPILRGVRWAGIRWPGAEGPGISFRVGRFARAVISEELLSYHLNIFGGTGRGKSTLIRELLYQIEARGETAVVHDPKREFYREFYSEERGDIAFDPRLADCPYWALEEEAEDEPEGTSWAKSFLPSEARSQPFFVKVPRAIFAYLLSRYSAYNEPGDPATCASLGYWLAKGPVEILKRLKGTEHYISLNRGGKQTPEISDQSQGLYTTLGQLAKPLRMMPANPEGRTMFSVKRWAQKRKGWIFLCSEPKTQEAIAPLHSAIADMLILHTQAEVRDRFVPRVWFVLDEVATMGRIDQLESGTTKQRASGNPIVLGFHDIAQLRERYGDNGTRTITGQAYTNMTLGTGSEEEASHIERLLGHEEIDQLNENRPVHIFGHRARSWSNQIKDTAVITAAQIQALPRFRGFMLQEGRVVKVRIQHTERRFRREPAERIIPPLIFREEPEVNPLVEDLKEDANGLACAVDDEPPAPYEPPKKDAGRKGKKSVKNPFKKNKSASDQGQLNLEPSDEGKSEELVAG
jgi:hypothetical protein